MASRLTARSAIPGFNIALGLTLLYLALILLIPLAAVFLKTFTLTWDAFVAQVTAPHVLASLQSSFTTALAAAAINAVLGLVVAWVLVRHRFPGRRVINALVDLPFALPTAVAGIALTAIYSSSGWLGSPLLAALGIKVALTPLAILVALTLIGLPFVVRTVQPVLKDMDRRQTLSGVLLPAVAPALLTGVALAFARAAGEYGSVILIAANLPILSELAPLTIVAQLEQSDYAGATNVAVVMLVASFVSLLGINLLQLFLKKNA